MPAVGEDENLTEMAVCVGVRRPCCACDCISRSHCSMALLATLGASSPASKLGSASIHVHLLWLVCAIATF